VEGTRKPPVQQFAPGAWSLLGDHKDWAVVPRFYIFISNSRERTRLRSYIQPWANSPDFSLRERFRKNVPNLLGVKPGPFDQYRHTDTLSEPLHHVNYLSSRCNGCGLSFPDNRFLLCRSLFCSFLFQRGSLCCYSLDFGQ